MSWLLTRDDGEIRRLTLNRPERKNAVPPEGWPVLRDAFADFEKSTARVLIITGAEGEFCAGADLDGSGSAMGESVALRHRSIASSLVYARADIGQLRAVLEKTGI